MRASRKIVRTQLGLLPSEWPEPDDIPEAQAKRTAQDLFIEQCRAHHLPIPVRDYRFAKASTGRQFEADAAFLEFKLIVEVQGGIWMPGGGAHSRPMNIERDVEKQQFALVLGWSLLPVTPTQVKKLRAIELTKMVLASRGWKGFAHESPRENAQ